MFVGAPVVGLIIYRAFFKTPSNSWRSQKYDPKTGLGRGAPGFHTNVQRVAVPPEIMERIRRGEEVSADEITAAQERMKRGEPEPAAKQKKQQQQQQQPENEWLPATPTRSGGGAKKRSGGGKR